MVSFLLGQMGIVLSHQSLALCFSRPVSVLTGPTISMWRTYD